VRSRHEESGSTAQFYDRPVLAFRYSTEPLISVTSEPLSFFLLGATGRTGLPFLLQALARGQFVTILAGTLTGAPDSAKPAPITDPEKLQEASKTSYANLQQTIAGLSDADLKTPVKLLARI
jgi:hypothetical protein